MKQWGIIGPGAIATEFARALAQSEGVAYGVWGRDVEKSEQFAQKYGIKQVYQTLDEMLSSPDIDIVYVATPHHLHYSMMEQAIAHGKHVLCEKAITLNSEELENIQRLADDQGVIVLEAMTIYHMPLFEELRRRVQAGAIGRVNMIHVTFGSYKEDDPSNRFFNPELAGGAMLDIGTYALSFARNFLDEEVVEVLTTMKPYKTGVDEQSSMILRTGSDQMVNITLAMRTKLPKQGVVAGEEGYITVNAFPRATEATITYTKDGSVETVQLGETEQALRYEIDAMHRVISGESDETRLYSRDVMTWMDRIRQQWKGTHHEQRN
ncbi:Gfo/Idh/MocA family oxidoreductase [Exiguobacterium sp. s22]|uniref:Gfo/Idh/MocA family protein n=1 Tax=Exiguobacterium sp. s22 TaxID=2751272 RepID=UPI001BE52C83|nr:Gfo/Idh/MocA family oxidoreductase [Exiguobacterium sp. s22]